MSPAHASPASFGIDSISSIISKLLHAALLTSVHSSQQWISDHKPGTGSPQCRRGYPCDLVSCAPAVSRLHSHHRQAASTISLWPQVPYCSFLSVCLLAIFTAPACRLLPLYPRQCCPGLHHDKCSGNPGVCNMVLLACDIEVVHWIGVALLYPVHNQFASSEAHNCQERLVGASQAPCASTCTHHIEPGFSCTSRRSIRSCGNQVAISEQSSLATEDS